ncbi:hypothetical protein ACLHDD_03300 [Pantoea sp. NSTU24]|uniref:hypothetical protein n=1 Tax=Pantoea sp. NSTU24 TaxID=3391144 RepID=UPI003D095674
MNERYPGSAKALACDYILSVKKIALSHQRDSDVNAGKKEIDLLLKKLRKAINISSPLSLYVWTKMEAEFRKMIVITCDPCYLSIIRHARYRSRIYRDYAMKKFQGSI